MTLGFVKLEEIAHLRGCYLITKEDTSVFKDPVEPPPENKPVETPKRQWMLNVDYLGFDFAPKHLMETYKRAYDKYVAEQSKKESKRAGWPYISGRSVTFHAFAKQQHFNHST